MKTVKIFIKEISEDFYDQTQEVVIEEEIKPLEEFKEIKEVDFSMS